MFPVLQKGDVIIAKQMSSVQNLKEGEVLIYKINNRIIVHRITKISVVEDEYIITTKGDNNLSEDNWDIYENMILGTVKTRIMFVGWPTLWLNSLLGEE